MLEEQLRHIEGLAVLEIPLVDVIPADLFSKLVGSLGTLYFWEIWLDLAAASTAPHPFPDEYPLSLAESLFISRCEIGSPKKVPLLGKRNSVMAIAVLLGAVLAVPKGTAEIITAVQEARRLAAETERIHVD